jgi:hypothetical protein
VRVGVCLVEWVCACMYYTTYMLQNSISYLRTMPLCPNANLKNLIPLPGNTKGGLLFDWFGISCTTNDNFLFLFAK